MRPNGPTTTSLDTDHILLQHYFLVEAPPQPDITSLGPPESKLIGTTYPPGTASTLQSGGPKQRDS